MYGATPLYGIKPEYHPATRTVNPTSAPLSSSASVYTSSGFERLLDIPSAGNVLTILPKTIAETALDWMGEQLQGGYDAYAETRTGQVRYWTGAALCGLANLGGGVVDTVRSSVDVSVAATKHVGQTALFFLPTSPRPDWMSYIEQHEITTDVAVDAYILITNYRQALSGQSRYSANIDELIPNEVLARRKGEPGYTGELLTMNVATDNHTLRLTGSAWSGLAVDVYKQDNGKIALAFGGTNGIPDGTWVTSAAATVGIQPSAFKQATKLVSAFVKKHGADNVEIWGHSLGGALAQYAGIDNGVKVTAFNSLGLHVTQRNELGGKMSHANVTHVNTGGDWLSQGVQHITAATQVTTTGQLFFIPGDGGHNDSCSELKNWLIQKNVFLSGRPTKQNILGHIDVDEFSDSGVSYKYTESTSL